jgi:hypothetical protein
MMIPLVMFMSVMAWRSSRGAETADPPIRPTGRRAHRSTRNAAVNRGPADDADNHAAAIPRPCCPLSKTRSVNRGYDRQTNPKIGTSRSIKQHPADFNVVPRIMTN